MFSVLTLVWNALSRREVTYCKAAAHENRSSPSQSYCGAGFKGLSLVLARLQGFTRLDGWMVAALTTDSSDDHSGSYPGSSTSQLHLYPCITATTKHALSAVMITGQAGSTGKWLQIPEFPQGPWI